MKYEDFIPTYDGITKIGSKSKLIKFFESLGYDNEEEFCNSLKDDPPQIYKLGRTYYVVGG